MGEFRVGSRSQFGRAGVCPTRDDQEGLDDDGVSPRRRGREHQLLYAASRTGKGDGTACGVKDPEVDVVSRGSGVSGIGRDDPDRDDVILAGRGWDDGKSEKITGLG
jgi:hypothetical protein